MCACVQYGVCACEWVCVRVRVCVCVHVCVHCVGAWGTYGVHCWPEDSVGAPRALFCPLAARGVGGQLNLSLPVA